MIIYSKESLIALLIQIRERGWVENVRQNNTGGVGNTLEYLLGIQENNLPIPNAAEWELKAHRKNTPSLITLFHMEPSPTACKFVSKILLPNYGWAHKQAGQRYGADEMSFRQTIRANQFSDRGFSVRIDRTERKFAVVFDARKIDDRHHEWRQSVTERAGTSGLNPYPYWGFGDLFCKVGTKLHNCFYLEADVKKKNGKEYFHYTEIMMLSDLSPEKFVQAVEDGHVYVDFDARTGHNHGTKFRIKSSAIPSLYARTKSF